MTICFILLMFASPDLKMVEIRNLYELSSKNESANVKLIKLLSHLKPEDFTLEGYRGAAIMMEANYLINPFTKLSRFKKGKQIIEKAIRQDEGNIELRYVRLTLQANAPRFLGYFNSIEIDKKFIITELPKLTDKDLRNRIVNYLILSKICNSEELKKISVWKNKN